VIIVFYLTLLRPLNNIADGDNCIPFDLLKLIKKVNFEIYIADRKATTFI